MSNPLSSDWLESVADRVPDERDRVLIREVVASARAGAYRLAVIGAWLAAAESLKRRFQDLAQSDSEAGLVMAKVERRESSQRSVDRFLVDKAHEYGLTSVVETHALQALYEARNIFGHPYTEQPTEDDVRGAIASAVDHLLSKPLLLRHSFVREEIARIIQRRGLLSDSPIAVRRRVDLALGRVDPSIHGYLFTGLLRAADSQFEDVEFLEGVFARRVQWFLEGMIEVCGASLWHTLSIEELVDQYPRLGSLVLSHQLMFADLNEGVRDSVFGELCEHTVTSQAHLERILVLRNQSLLSEPEMLRFRSTLDGLGIESLVAQGVPLEMYAGRIVAELASHTWPRQNPAATALASAGGKQVRELDAALQEQLGRNVLQSADGTARASRALLGTLRSDATAWPNAFLFGLVGECFANENGRFRIKGDRLREAVGALATLPEDRKREVIGQLSTLVEGSSTWGETDAEWAAGELERVLGPDSARLVAAVRERQEPGLGQEGDE